MLPSSVTVSSSNTCNVEKPGGTINCFVLMTAMPDGTSAFVSESFMHPTACTDAVFTTAVKELITRSVFGAK
jgi:hypothetical protein